MQANSYVLIVYTHRLFSPVCITSYFPTMSLPLFSPVLKYCGTQVKEDTKNEYLSILVAEACLVFNLTKLIYHCVSLAVCFACMAAEAGGKAYAAFGRKLFAALHLSEGNRALMSFFLCEWLVTK